MRLLLLLTFIALPSFACPELSGNYKVCKSQSGQMPNSYDFTVIQKSINDTNVFHVVSTDDAGEKNIDTFKADSKVYEQDMADPYTGMKLFYSTQAKCENNSLVVENKIMNETIIMTLSKSGKNLIQKISGKSQGKEVLDIITCE